MTTQTADLPEGSSPLTRGKRVVLRHHVDHAGLIPAHAGKTLMVRPIHSRTGAHPRSRGENSMASPSRRPRRGSSPLTRGKRVGGETDCSALGLIPAHAGKTSPSAPR